MAEGGGPTVLVVNAAARQGEEDAGRVRAALRARGVQVDAVELVSEPGRLPEVLRAALERKPARLLVGGGDGTISLAAGLLAGSEIALGVLPLGTGNDFARSLRLPRELDAACDVIAAGETRRVPSSGSGSIRSQGRSPRSRTSCRPAGAREWAGANAPQVPMLDLRIRETEKLLAYRDTIADRLRRSDGDDGAGQDEHARRRVYRSTTLPERAGSERCRERHLRNSVVFELRDFHTAGVAQRIPEKLVSSLREHLRLSRRSKPAA